MNTKSRSDLAAVGMILGGLPLSATMYLFLDMIAARQAGHPSGGDAIGMMMMALVTYAIAAASSVIGTLYFCILRVKSGSRPNAWQAIVLTCSLAQTSLPIIYFLRV